MIKTIGKSLILIASFYGTGMLLWYLGIKGVVGFAIGIITASALFIFKFEEIIALKKMALMNKKWK